MKSLVDVMRELELEGFELTGGEFLSNDCRVWTFARYEGVHSLSTVRVTRFQEEVEEGETEDWEDEQMVYSQEEMEFIRRALGSRFYDAEAVLMCTGNLPIPEWLQKKVLERRKVKNEQV